MLACEVVHVVIRRRTSACTMAFFTEFGASFYSNVLKVTRLILNKAANAPLPGMTLGFTGI